MVALTAVTEAVAGHAVGACPATFGRLADLAAAGPQDLTFAGARVERAALHQSRAGAVLVAHQHHDRLAAQAPNVGGWIVVGDPRLALAQAAVLFAPPPVAGGVHASAVVATTAQVHPSARLGPFVVVEAGARVGPGAHLAAHAFVGADAQVAAGAQLHVGAKLLAGCVLGERSILQAGAVVGSDGFGFAADGKDGRRWSMPSLGSVVIEADVEVGANSCIDRGTFGCTRIGRGTKIDNQVQVAHNVQLGSDNVIVAQSGIAGSSQLGPGVVCGAQVGIADHRHIAAGVQLAARCGVMQDLPRADGRFGGSPARPMATWLKQTLAQRRLPEVLRRLAALEARLASSRHAQPAGPPVLAADAPLA